MQAEVENQSTEDAIEYAQAYLEIEKVFALLLSINIFSI